MHRKKILPLLLFLLVFSSCMPGYRAAQGFLEKKEQMAVMIVPPSFTYLYYYPFVSAAEPDYMGEPAALDQSEFLEDLDEQEATAVFMEALLEGLKAYGLGVFGPEEFDSFLAFPGQRYIFTIAQSEIVEYDQEVVDRALIDTTLYRQEFLLRHVARNTWFEFVKVDENAPESTMQVLYSHFLTADYLNGRFRYRGLSGEVFYEYSSVMISLEDVYELQQFAGQGNARYIFDFLLNRYVQQNARPLLAQPAYFRYNPQSKTISRVRDEFRFVIMEEQE